MHPTTHCKNCATELQGEFCFHCGQKLIEGRLTVKVLLSNFFIAIVNLEKGFLHTAKLLFVDPQKIIRDVWNRVNMPYTPAFRYVLIWATLAVIVNVGLGVFDLQEAQMKETFGVQENSKTARMQIEIMETMKKYMSFVMIMIVPFLAIGSHRLFKKEGFNYAEHLIMNTYFMGQQALIGIPFMFIMILLPQLTQYYMFIGIIINGLYLAYAFKSVFELSNGQAIWRGILTYIIGYLLYMVAIMIFTLVGIIGYMIYVKVLQ
jgi:hypothetical protein